jgi:hypothetical protein
LLKVALSTKIKSSSLLVMYYIDYILLECYILYILYLLILRAFLISQQIAELYKTSIFN